MWTGVSRCVCGLAFGFACMLSLSCIPERRATSTVSMVPAREPSLRFKGAWFNDQTIWAEPWLDNPVLSPDGRQVAVLSAREILVLDLVRVETIAAIGHALENGSDGMVEFSADGSAVMAVGERAVQSWDLPSGRLRGTTPRDDTPDAAAGGPRLIARRRGAWMLDALGGMGDLPDRSWSTNRIVMGLAATWQRSGCTKNPIPYGVDVRRAPEGWPGRETVTPPKGSLVGFDLSSDSRYLSASGEQGVRVVDLQANRVLMEASFDLSERIGRARLSAGGRYLWARARNDVEVWRTSDGKRLWRRPFQGDLTFLDEAGLVWVHGWLAQPSQRDRVLRAENGEEVLTLDDKTWAVLEAPSTRKLVTVVNREGGARIVLRDFVTARPLPREHAHRGPIRQIAIGDGARSLITVDESGLVLARDLASGRTRVAEPASRPVGSSLPPGWTVKLWREGLRLEWPGDATVLYFEGESPTAVSVSDRQVFVATNAANIYRYDLTK